jgi:hypothetical protein
MQHPIKAWVLEEKKGGRKGKWISAPWVPFHFPLTTALFSTRNDAITFMRNSKTEDEYDVVSVEIFINRSK